MYGGVCERSLSSYGEGNIISSSWVMGGVNWGAGTGFWGAGVAFCVLTGDFFTFLLVVCFSGPLAGGEPSEVFARLSRSSRRLLSFLPVVNC